MGVWDWHTGIIGGGMIGWVEGVLGAVSKQLGVLGADQLRVSQDGKMEIWWDRSVETTQKMEHY